ncbi:MAG: prepilin-type N-terminal cleavage/methylation domain-containing protein [Candidatus Omnitrophica bacterium]|nr:prepilin-type N-terminal cleavage/methylation domain-containing protein [Candidatus Omnitrophota bacterium]
MILQTGKQKRSNSSGFTLLELLLVAVIILALVTISTPLFKRTYEDLRLTSSAKDISVIMQFCRERAIFERIPYRFLLNIDKKNYKILRQEEDEDDFEAIQGRWGKTFKISEAIEIEADEEAIDFLPDGNITPALIYLTNRDEVTHTVSTESATGLIKVYDYKFEPEE